MRLRIDLAYDGGRFHGWAKQPTLRTVQGELEDDISRILHMDESHEPLRLTVAGRTDAGVHASHQVCHLDVEPELLAGCVGYMGIPAADALKVRLNRMLPDDIAIYSIQVAPAGFDARFSALERTYMYRIRDAGSPVDPRLSGFVLPIDDALDIEAMNDAAAMMRGLHDFGSFARPAPGGTTIREVKSACWRRVMGRPLFDSSLRRETPASAAAQETLRGSRGRYEAPIIESGLLCFTIVADAFAHNMVRSLVGASVKLGRHAKPLQWFERKMAVPLREGAAGPIAAKGLTLEYVAYPPDGELASRAEALHARREL